MKTFATCIALVCIAATFIGCEELIAIWTSNPGRTPITSYPLKVGNQWMYNRSFYTYNYRPIDPTYQFQHQSYSSSLTVDITRLVLLPRIPGGIGDSIEVTEFRSMESGISLPGYSYYSMSTGNLLLHGYQSGSMINPRPTEPRQSFVLGTRTFSSPEELLRFFEGATNYDAMDTLVREYPPLLSVKYPLTEGEQWIYRPNGRPFRIDKRTGAMRIDQAHGLWYREVRWLYDLDGNGIWDDNISVVDRISSKGLIRRTLDFKNILVTTEGNPEGVGIVDFKDEFVLSSMIVP